MITFQLKYTLNPELIADFQEYAKKFVELTKKYGGEHYGYFINLEKARTTALAIFSFPSIVSYNAFRRKVVSDPQYEKAVDLARKTHCIKHCYRTVYNMQVA